MSTKNFTEYNLTRDAYTAFDATSLKNLIINKLNENEVFRDQSFEGSNLNAFIDIVSYMYHVLLFYLNTTSSETTFTTAELYENMNKLVSNLGYKPTGRQTSLALVSLSGTSNLPQNIYTVPRFSTLVNDGIAYSTIEDITFEKTSLSNEALSIDNNILYQGRVSEYPLYTATGEEYETITIVDSTSISDSSTFISDNSFTVFVQNAQTQVWEEWSETSSLFLEGSTDVKYEKRLNEFGYYEFKFGNNTNGKKLNEGDLVQIYYIVSDGVEGAIGSNFLQGSNFVLYNTPRFSDVASDIYPSVNTVTPNLLPFIVANNANASSPVSDAETVEEMRENAPKIFSTQNRLVTKEDYETFVRRSFSAFIRDVRVLNNDTYTKQYLEYFYSIGLNRPNEDARVLFNQVSYSGSTSFNNVYLFMVPKINTIINETTPNYLNSAQKQIIINQCSPKKNVIHNIVCADPIYRAFDIGTSLAGEDPYVDIKDNSVLVIKKDAGVRSNLNTLREAVAKVIKDYFDSMSLGQVVNLQVMSSDILNIPGVKGIFTRRIDTNHQVPRLSLLSWNPSYREDDISIVTQNLPLKEFEYGYFYNISTLKNKIIVENE